MAHMGTMTGTFDEGARDLLQAYSELLGELLAVCLRLEAMIKEQDMHLPVYGDEALRSLGKRRPGEISWDPNRPDVLPLHETSYGRQVGEVKVNVMGSALGDEALREAIRNEVAKTLKQAMCPESVEAEVNAEAKQWLAEHPEAENEVIYKGEWKTVGD